MTKVYNTLFYGFFLIIPFICSINSFKFIVARPEELKLTFGLPVLILFLLFAPQKRDLNLKDPLIRSVIFFAVWGVLSLIWAHNFYYGAYHALPLVGSVIGAYVVYKYLEDINKFYWILVITGALVALVGLIQTLSGKYLFNNLGEFGATFGNKNMASQYINLTIPLGFALFFKDRKNWPALFLAQTSVIFIIYGQSRAAWIALSSMTLFFIGVSFFRKKIKFEKRSALILTGSFLYLILGVWITASLYGGGAESLKKRAEFTLSQVEKGIGAKKDGANERISHWVNTLGMVKDNPLLGVGIGNWYIEYPLYHSKYIEDGASYNMGMKLKNLHNDWLEILASLGIIGFGVFVCIFFFIFRAGFKLIDKNHYLILGAMTGVIAFMIHSAFSFPMRLYLPFLITLSYGAIIKTFESNIKESTPVRWSTYMGFGLFMVLSLGVSANHLQASHDFFKAMVFSINSNKKGVNKDLALKYMTHHAQMAHKKNPMHVNNAILLAKGLHHFKKPKEALDNLIPLYKHYPYHQSLLHNLGYLSYINQDYSKAIFYWEEVLKYQKDPKYQNEIQTNLNKLKNALRRKK